jgi:hypothetical protein
MSLDDPDGIWADYWSGGDALDLLMLIHHPHW